jgi:hypothetical protein
MDDAMTKRHPDTKFITDKPGFPSVADIEVIGESWAQVTDEYLVGFSTQSWGTDAANQTPAVLEMQRRLKVSAEASIAQAAEHSAEQSKLQREHTAAIRDFDDASARSASAASAQTTEVIELTKELKNLTLVLKWLTIAAVFFSAIQGIGILVHLYRWYRGWL